MFDATQLIPMADLREILETTPRDFIDYAQDPKSWYSVAQRKVSDARLLYVEATSLLETDQDSNDLEDDQAIEAFLSLTQSSLFLAAIALENALRGVLLSDYPDQVTIELTLDGNGNPEGAEISRIGDSMGGGVTHDLNSLARDANLFGVGENPILQDKSEMEMFENALDYLTHTLQWSGRYPVPLTHEQDQKWKDILSPLAREEPGKTEVHGVMSFRRTCFLAAYDLVDHITPGEAEPETDRRRGVFDPPSP